MIWRMLYRLSWFSFAAGLVFFLEGERGFGAWCFFGSYALWSIQDWKRYRSVGSCRQSREGAGSPEPGGPAEAGSD